MPDEPGCTVNADGTLKDASKIIWTHSRSPSPDLLAIPPLVPEKPSQSPQLVCLAPNQEVADLAKPSEKWQKHNPCRLITSAQPLPKKRQNLTYHNKIQIMELADGPGRGLSQGAIAQHFHFKWPTLSQDNISKILSN